MAKRWQDFERKVLTYVKEQFPDCTVKREVTVGRTIFGRRRRLDGVVISPDGTKMLGLEIKLQNTPGTSEEKMVFAHDDAKACPLETLIVYGGDGWGDGALAYLRGNKYAVEFNEDPNQLRMAVGIRLGFFDVIDGEEIVLNAENDNAGIQGKDESETAA